MNARVDELGTLRNHHGYYISGVEEGEHRTVCSLWPMKLQGQNSLVRVHAEQVLHARNVAGTSGVDGKPCIHRLIDMAWCNDSGKHRCRILYQPPARRIKLILTLRFANL